MTLEIEYPNGDTETAAAKIKFFNTPKAALILIPDQLIGLRAKESAVAKKKKGTQIVYRFDAKNVERRATNHGVVYSGTVVDADNKEAKFFLYP